MLVCIARNELIRGYAGVYVKFIPSTHTHILIPFEDRKPTGLVKVDIAKI